MSTLGQFGKEKESLPSLAPTPLFCYSTNQALKRSVVTFQRVVSLSIPDSGETLHTRSSRPQSWLLLEIDVIILLETYKQNKSALNSLN